MPFCVFSLQPLSSVTFIIDVEQQQCEDGGHYQQVKGKQECGNDESISRRLPATVTEICKT